MFWNTQAFVETPTTKKLKRILLKAVALNQVTITADPTEISFHMGVSFLYLTKLNSAGLSGRLNDATIQDLLTDRLPVGYVSSADIGVFGAGCSVLPMYYSPLSAKQLRKVLHALQTNDTAEKQIQALNDLFKLFKGHWERYFETFLNEHPDLKSAYDIKLDSVDVNLYRLRHQEKSDKEEANDLATGSGNADLS